MEKKVHPITGFEIIRERDNRERYDIIVEPLTSKNLRVLVSSEGRLSKEWFYALRGL